MHEKLQMAQQRSTISQEASKNSDGELHDDDRAKHTECVPDWVKLRKTYKQSSASIKKYFFPKVNHVYKRYKKWNRRKGNVSRNFLRWHGYKWRRAILLSWLMSPFGTASSLASPTTSFESNPTVDLQKAVDLCWASEQAPQQLTDIATETRTVDALTNKKPRPRKN